MNTRSDNVVFFVWIYRLLQLANTLQLDDSDLALIQKLAGSDLPSQNSQTSTQVSVYT